MTTRKLYISKTIYLKQKFVNAVVTKKSPKILDKKGEKRERFFGKTLFKAKPGKLGATININMNSKLAGTTMGKNSFESHHSFKRVFTHGCTRKFTIHIYSYSCSYSPHHAKLQTAKFFKKEFYSCHTLRMFLFKMCIQFNTFDNSSFRKNVSRKSSFIVSFFVETFPTKRSGLLRALMNTRIFL